MEKINEIKDKYATWFCVDDFSPNAYIADDVQVISCDTRDFAVCWRETQPKPYKNADCNLEEWTNRGLKRLNLLVVSPVKDYIIQKSEIISWLQKLNAKTGGRESRWRFFTADLNNCRDWDAKYIRFVRNTNDPNQFFVCNKYYAPIKWREVYDKIDINLL